MSSGRCAKHSPIARMMPSLSALRLAGRLRPTVSTLPAVSTLSRSDEVAAAVSEAFPIDYYVLSRIVIYYNYLDRSQCLPSSRRTPELVARMERSEIRDQSGR